MISANTEMEGSMQECSSLGRDEASAAVGDGELVEESGPVDYCEDEGEGTLDDSDLEQLTYDDDPLLLLSDYEEEGEAKLTTDSCAGVGVCVCVCVRGS